jgi:putative oxidoreductase
LSLAPVGNIRDFDRDRDYDLFKSVFRAREADMSIAGIAQSVALLIGRLLLALIFVHESFTLIGDFSGAAGYMARQGISMPLFVAVIALQLGGGLSLVFGLLARLGAVALGLFCIGTALMFHTDFASQNELLHFEKDLGLAGGMFVLAATGAGRFSLDCLLEQRLMALFRRRR